MNRTTQIPLSSCRRIHNRCRADEAKRQDDERSVFDFDVWHAKRWCNGHRDDQMRFSVLLCAAGAGIVLWIVAIFAFYGAIKACEALFR